MDLLAKTNVGRDINRHYYTLDEINRHLERPLIKDLKNLMIFRNTHAAFNGTFNLVSTPDNVLHIKWENNQNVAELIVDLANTKMDIHFSEDGQMKSKAMV